MKRFAKKWETLFTVCLILGLVGCSQDEMKPFCPDGKIVVISPADSNDHGVEVSACSHEDHYVILEAGKYIVDNYSSNGNVRIRILHTD